jgi:hypothetical protein
MNTITTENIIKGNKMINIVKKKSGPKREALICTAVFELQNGHALDVKENKIRHKKIRCLISILF